MTKSEQLKAMEESLEAVLAKLTPLLIEASEIAARRAAIPGGGHGRHDSHETCRQAAKLIEHLCALILDGEHSFDYCW